MCCSFSPVPVSLASVATFVAAKPNHGFFNCQHPEGVRCAPCCAGACAPRRRAGLADARRVAAGACTCVAVAMKSACFMHSASRDLRAPCTPAPRDAGEPRRLHRRRGAFARVSNRFSFASVFGTAATEMRESAQAEAACATAANKNAGLVARRLGKGGARGERSRRPLPAQRSVLFVFDQLGVVVGRQQLVELVRLVDLDHEQPALAVGILVDRLRLVGERAVDRDDGAGHR